MEKKIEPSMDKVMVTFTAFNESNERILVHIYVDNEENAKKFLSALASYDVIYNPICSYRWIKC